MPRVIITVPKKTPQPYRFSLDREVVTLGRGKENDIVIESGSVSVQHAEMRRVEGGFEIEDLGSTNGIKLDDKRQMKFKLKSGMIVSIGEATFDFTLSDEEHKALGIEKPPTDEVISEKVILEEHVDPEEPAPSPPPRKRKSPLKPVPSASQSPIGSFMMIVLFLIFATASFFTGAAIRYQRDTGESLLKGFANKGEVEKSETIPAEAEVKKTAE